MAGIARRYPLLSVGTDLQPLPGDARRPATPLASRETQAAVIALVRRGQAEGSLRPDLPAEALGTGIADLLLNEFAAQRVAG
jgi:TetR/AcrR family transcriptional regulator, mexCD-oprJ operon repressor